MPVMLFSKLILAKFTRFPPAHERLIVPNTHKPRVLLDFEGSASPLGAKWHLLIFLMCIFMIANEIEHLFMALLVIFFFFLAFLGPLPWYVEVPRLGVQSEL